MKVKRQTLYISQRKELGLHEARLKLVEQRAELTQANRAEGMVDRRGG